MLNFTIAGSGGIEFRYFGPFSPGDFITALEFNLIETALTAPTLCHMAVALFDSSQRPASLESAFFLGRQLVGSQGADASSLGTPRIQVAAGGTTPTIFRFPICYEVKAGHMFVGCQMNTDLTGEAQVGFVALDFCNAEAFRRAGAGPGRSAVSGGGSSGGSGGSGSGS